MLVLIPQGLSSLGSRSTKFKLKRRKAGVLPRLENGDLTEANPPNLDRFQLWLQSNIHVEGRPDWLFVKLHTHGCKPSNMNMLLGGELQEFYEQVASIAPKKMTWPFILLLHVRW